VQAAYWGKKGKPPKLMKGLGRLSPRPTAGGGEISQPEPRAAIRKQG